MSNIYQAISEILKETDAITKDRKNTQQGYSFRGIDDVYNAVHPLFAKHGVFSVPQVLEDRTEERTTAKGSALIYRVLKIKYLFCAADGSSLEAVVIGEGMDSGDKASNKAMAVAHKYAILQILAIPTEEEKDPEVQSHETIPKKQEPKAESNNESKSILMQIGEIVKNPAFSDKERQFYRDSCKGKTAEQLADILREAQEDFTAKSKKNSPVEESVLF